MEKERKKGNRGGDERLCTYFRCTWLRADMTHRKDRKALAQKNGNDLTQPGSNM